MPKRAGQSRSHSGLASGDGGTIADILMSATEKLSVLCWVVVFVGFSLGQKVLKREPSSLKDAPPISLPVPVLPVPLEPIPAAKFSL